MARNKKRGQSIVEYVLLVGILSMLSIGYMNFYGKKVLAKGFKNLSGKAGSCLSQQGGTTANPPCRP